MEQELRFGLDLGQMADFPAFIASKSFNLHSGLRFNLNLCLFLQTFNAISGSEYVKIGSMCIFFLISVIGLSENTTLNIFRVKFE